MNDFLTVGYIFAVKGLKGEVKIRPLTSKKRFFEGNVLKINPPLEEYVDLTIEKVFISGENYVVKFKEIQTVEEANKTKNHYLEVKKSSLPENTYYSDDLIGLDVYDEKNSKLGKIIEVSSSKAHDILKVKGERIFFLPVTKEFIKKVDIKKGKITIKPIEGII